jgi:hypothetical protein
MSLELKRDSVRDIAKPTGCGHSRGSRATIVIRQIGRLHSVLERTDQRRMDAPVEPVAFVMVI